LPFSPEYLRARLSSLAPSAARFFSGFLTRVFRSSASKSPGLIDYSGRPALLEFMPRGGGFCRGIEVVPSPLVLSPPDVLFASFLLNLVFNALFFSFFFTFAALIFCCLFRNSVCF
jgi:hypothetical protein